MSTIIRLKDGRREYITGERDFAELIYRELGLDAYEYVQEITQDAEHWRAMEDSEESKYDFWERCPGECDKVYRTQEHYEAILQIIREELASWKMKVWKKPYIEMKRDELYRYVDRKL